jgi:GH24 family phage-related lysozyme (muramidase)
MKPIRATPRGKAAIAAAIIAAAAAYASYNPTPDDVILARTALVRPWEGRELRAYLDRIAEPDVWTVCDGDTIDVKPNMLETPEGCDKRLDKRLMQFRAKLVKCHAGWEKYPLSWRAMMLSLSYNAGPGAGCSSTAANLGRQGRWYESCLAATKWNKAGGKMVMGLVYRREMGDATRIGEAELCVSGL